MVMFLRRALSLVALGAVSALMAAPSADALGGPPRPSRPDPHPPPRFPLGNPLAQHPGAGARRHLAPRLCPGPPPRPQRAAVRTRGGGVLEGGGFADPAGGPGFGL